MHNEAIESPSPCHAAARLFTEAEVAGLSPAVVLKLAQVPQAARQALLQRASAGRLRSGDIEVGRRAALAAEDQPAEAVAVAAVQAALRRRAEGSVPRRRPASAVPEGLGAVLQAALAPLLLMLGQLLGELRAQRGAAPAPSIDQERRVTPREVEAEEPARSTAPETETETAAEAEAPAPPALTAPLTDHERRVQALCEDYAPQPRPPQGLVVPLPAAWRDDPSYRLNDPCVLGASAPTPQAGTIGRLLVTGQRVGLNLNESFCLSTFSVPGGGKTYLLGNVLQMALQPLRYLNELPRPHCGILFHYHGSAGYEPEILSAIQPNQNAREVLDLMERYGALPAGLDDVVLLCPLSQVEKMRARHPHVRVFPILFSPSELGSEGFRTLLGINDASEDTLYARRLRRALQDLREELSWESLQARLADDGLDGQARDHIEARLSFVRPYLAEGYPLRRLLRPGRLVIVDVRDEWVPRKEALSLFALLSTILTRREEGAAPLLLCFDEAHKYTESRVLRAELVRLVRERRHLGLSVLLASQDPLSLPLPLIALSDHIALGKVQSEEWLRRLAKANDAFRPFRAKLTSKLAGGRMLWWSERMHIDGVDRRELATANPLQVRPQCAHHGGATRTAV